MLDPKRLDYADRFMVAIEPYNRLALARFRNTGVVAPFSTDSRSFNQLNRFVVRSTSIQVLTLYPAHYTLQTVPG
jgi:hypothetical protein